MSRVCARARYPFLNARVRAVCVAVKGAREEEMLCLVISFFSLFTAWA